MTTGPGKHNKEVKDPTTSNLKHHFQTWHKKEAEQFVKCCKDGLDPRKLIEELTGMIKAKHFTVTK